MPTFSFSLSQTEIVCARNNTIATASISGLVHTTASYFLVSLWHDAVKISESYLPGAEGFGKMLVSPILQAYSEAKTLLPTTINSPKMPYLLLTAKCAYHHVADGVDTVYNAPDVVFNLILALVPNVYYLRLVVPNFTNFVEYQLDHRGLSYKPDNEAITATEVCGFSFLASPGTTREGWLAYTNFRIQYFLTFEDYSSEVITHSIMTAVPYASIHSFPISFAIVDAFKTVAKKIISFRIKILANNGSYDVAITNWRTYLLDTRQYEFERTFCFLNSLGTWEYFSTHAMRKVSHAVKKERFTSFSDLSVPKQVNMDQSINISATSKAVIDTGVYDRKKIAAIQEIVESPLVYLVKVNNINQPIYLPITITSEKLASFDDEDYLDSFSFEYEFNHTETSTQDFLI